MAVRRLVCWLFGCPRRVPHAAPEIDHDEDDLLIVCPRCSRVRVRLVRARSADDRTVADAA